MSRPVGELEFAERLERQQLPPRPPLTPGEARERFAEFVAGWRPELYQTILAQLEPAGAEPAGQVARPGQVTILPHPAPREPAIAAPAAGARYAPSRLVATQSGSRLVLPFNARRAQLLIVNLDQANFVWVNVGAHAEPGSCIPVRPLGNWEPFTPPVNEVYLAGDVAGSNVVIVEGSK